MYFLMKVLVVGAGWYGCEICSKLEELGVDFDIVDRRNDFFMESSSRNQNRLHFGGFHYSRSYTTRAECRRGYDRYVGKYPKFSVEVDSYYVVSRDSMLDFETYVSIYKHEQSFFSVHPLESLVSRGISFRQDMVDGSKVILVKERFVDFVKVKEHFQQKFVDKLKHFSVDLLEVSNDFEKIVFNNKPYDLVFDATYGKLFPMENSVFELCLTLVYRKTTGSSSDDNKCSVTVVDGDFFSLYPYDIESNLFTLTHVVYTPVFTSDSLPEVESFTFSSTALNERKHLMEVDVCRWIPEFLDTHVYVDFFTSTKTKFTDMKCADRSMRECRRGNVISVCGGKITGAFDVGEVVTKGLRKTLR